MSESHFSHVRIAGVKVFCLNTLLILMMSSNSLEALLKNLPGQKR